MPERPTDEDRMQSESGGGTDSTQPDAAAASQSAHEETSPNIQQDRPPTRDPQRFEPSAKAPDTINLTYPDNSVQAKISAPSARENADRKLKRPLLKASALIFGLFLFIGLIGFGFWVKQLNDTISARLQNALWEIPAKVYARPLEIYAGLAIQPAQLINELQRLGFKKGLAERPGFYSAVTDTSGGITRIDVFNRGFQFSDGNEAARNIAVLFERNRVKALQDLSTDTAEPPAVFRLEPSVIGSIHALQHEDREPVSVAQLPPGFIDTLVAVEDRKFYSHHGISLRGIARAIWVNFKTGRRAQGASTITQQLAKNLFLTPEKTLQRKSKEVVMALLLDFRLPKDEILELYINEVFLAQQGNRAIHGFGLASRFFYDKPLKDTTQEEYALLIGMIKAPSAYNPERNPERSMQRRNVVIRLMQERDVIDDATATHLSETPISLTPPKSDNTYGAYLDLVREQLVRDYPIEELQSLGLRIFTHLDPLIQHTAQNSLQTFVSQKVANSAPIQGAMLVTDANTAEVKAVVGGVDSRKGGFNRALDARRQVGSVIKPAVYLAALEKPQQYTLGTLLEDSPVSLQMPNGSVWQPQNFDKKTRGPVAAIDALADSLNLASVNLALELGMDRVVDALTRLGAGQDIPELPAVALGAVELSPLDVAQMYQTIAADGYNVPLRAISSVTTSEGELLSQYPITVEKVIESDPVYLLRYALTDVMLRGTGRGVSRFLPRQYYVAGKTGTSDERRDSWFAGFAGDYLGVVWLGNDEGKSIPYTGSSGALPVWGALMKKISTRPLQFNTSPSISYVSTDPVSGMRMPDNCKSAYLLPYIKGSSPQESIGCRGNNRPNHLQRLGRWLEDVLDLN